MWSRQTLKYWGMAFLFVHELDAVKCQEWRMLPLLSLLADNAGYQVFTALHVPIFAVILWELSGDHPRKKANPLLYGFSVFNIIHTGLHVTALWCPRNQFVTPLSWSLIVGGGLCGAVHVYQRRAKTTTGHWPGRDPQKQEIAD